MPTKASNIIRFLDYKPKYDLEELGTSDRDATILESRKF